jgi:hypothetical protein
MESVTVMRGDLIEKMKANRDEHRAIFEEALEGYRARAIEILEEHLERIKKGKVERVAVMLPIPEDHTRDYDRVLMMLDMSVDEQIQLDERRFQQYVLDDWTWQREFLTASSNYSSRARGKFDEL